MPACSPIPLPSYSGVYCSASCWRVRAGDDSVDRLIKAARPAGANVEEAKHIRSEVYAALSQTLRQLF
eukprot:5260185-Amphidinium_carterae.1